VIRYGIVGFGHHGRKRLVPAFAHAHASKLAGIWRRDQSKARTDAVEFGIDHVFKTAEDLFASPEIDAVFVTSPDAFHMRDTLLAIAHGKPVLCEKPLAMSAEQAKEMLTASRNANVIFGVAQNFRYNRSVNLIREWLQAGRIGKPVFATAQFCFQSERSPRAWIYDKSLAYSGPIGDVGIHCLDALRFILQDDVAAVTTIARSDLDSSQMETSAAVSLDFVQGALGSLSVSFRADYRTFIEVTCEHGVIQSENCLSVDGSVEVRLLQSGKVIQSQQVSNGDAYSRMLDAFSASILSKGDYAATGEDGLKNQLALDAAYASWHSGRQETIVY
jgi:1,5-anhydro-D-fructose reductase (1,5-anhydro-D-mannitol-forming)